MVFRARSLMQVKILHVSNLPKMDSGFVGMGGKCDPYVVVASQGVYRRDHNQVFLSG
jgi:hypothetical protein